MKMSIKSKKRTARVTLIILVTFILLPIFYFGMRGFIIDHSIGDKVTDIYHDPQFSRAIIIENTPTVRLSITCGYATIEWITEFLGERVSEQTLLSLNNGKITTAFPKKFGRELEKNLGGNFSVKSIYHASNQEILQTIHTSLDRGFPVPISFAAVDDMNKPAYTLHYSMVTGMDLQNDKIYLSNVYGYEEILSVQEFLDSMKFKNFKNMPIFIRLGIFFGLFDKNTIYVIEENSSVAVIELNKSE